MPIGLPVRRVRRRSDRITRAWPACVPCEALRRATSIPARARRARTAGSLDAGPTVQTIFAFRSEKEKERIGGPGLPAHRNHA